MAGSTVVHGGFHPAFSMMWAGNRLAEEHLPVGERVTEDHGDRPALVAALDRRDVPVAGRAGHRVRVDVGSSALLLSQA